MCSVKEITIDALDVQEWDNLLSRSEVCDAFQAYEWALVLQNSMGVQPRFLLVKCREQSIGGVMFFAKKMFGMIDSYEIRGGPLYIRGNKEIVMKSILRTLSEKKKKAVNLLFVPFPLINSGLKPIFNAQGYLSYPFRTTIIDLSRRLQDVWKALNKKARWGVRKAERLGLEVKEADTWQKWEQYYRLHLLHGREKQYPTKPPEFFRELFKLHQKNMSRLFLAQHEKHTIAGSLFLIYKQNMIFLQNASRAAFLSHNPNNLLQWKSIEWAKENGVATYDMNGLPPKEVPYLRGVYHYKKQWDGQIQWYYYYLNRKLLYTIMHLVRTNSFAWKLFLSARNLRTV